MIKSSHLLNRILSAGRVAIFGVAVISSLVLTSALSHADSLPADAQATWSRYFPGNAFVPDPEINLTLMLDAPGGAINEQCRELQKEVSAQVIDYGRKAYAKDNTQSYQVAGKILTGLHELENTQSPCFDSVARAYLATTLHLLNPENSNTEHFVQGNRINDRPVASGLELTVLGAALLNHKSPDGSFTVQFLTSHRRAQELQSSSAVWNQKTPDGKNFLVSAGYDCAQVTIVIDPYLMPLDLGSTFVHELDHAFRDRMKYLVGQTDTSLDGSLTPDTSLDRKTQLDHLALEIAVDETLASVVSGSFERHMSWYHRQKFNFTITSAFQVASGTGRPFRLSQDLTLFLDNKSNPMNEIWKSLENQDGTFTNGIDANASYLLMQTFLRHEQNLIPANERLNHPPLAAIQEIYQRIHRGYFNGSSISENDLKLLAPDNRGVSEDPFSFWLDLYKILREDDQTSAPFPMPGSWIQDVGPNQYASVMGKYKTPVKISYDYNHFFVGLEFVMNSFFEFDLASNYCRDYMNAIEDGSLPTYVGNSLSTINSQSIKPGETGVKPGETGVKPGETGVKPGETGVKPSLIRPCLNVGRDL